MNDSQHDPPYGSVTVGPSSRQPSIIVPARGPFCESWTVGPIRPAGIGDEPRPGFWKQSDPGSGTVLGAALIAVTALLMAALAMVGNMVLCRAQARTVADLGAIAAATAFADESDDAVACTLAADVVASNGGALVSCVIEGEDARVIAGVTTQVPIAPQVTYESRAGPVDCGS